MADNTTLNSGSGGDTIAADDITSGVANGAKVQRTKAGFGADNSYADPTGASGTVDAGTARVTLATDVALPAGTNAIGKLAANSGVDIGDVDVTDVIPGVGATNLGKAEDAAHTSGDVGVMALAVRNDTLAALSGADGDYSPLQVDDLGAQYVNQGNFYSTNNALTSASLAPSGTLQGSSDDVSKYGRAGISVYCSDGAGTIDGTLLIEVSHDGSAWSGPTRSWANIRFGEPHMWNIVEKYFRVKYTNGSVTATDISIQVQYSNNADIVLGHELSSSLLDETEAQVVRAVAVGKDQDGEYVNITATHLGAMNVEPEQHTELDTMNATTGWTVLGNDTTTLATSTNHVLGTNSLSFAKVDGAANTVFGGIQKTITSIDLGDISAHDIFQTAIYITSVADISYTFLRVGTDSSNYNEWRIDGVDLTAGIWESIVYNVSDANYSGNTGTGLDASAITYVAIGCAFTSESDTLAGIQFDEISFHTNQHTSASLNSEVTSSVSSSNINVQKIGGSAVDKNSGSKGNGSQRVVIATDDINLSAIKTATEAVAAAVSTEMQVDVVTSALPTGAATSAAQLADGHNVTVDNSTGASAVNIQDGGNSITVDWAGTTPPIGAGTETAALRVTLATDSTGVVSIDDNGSSITVDGTITANLSATDNAVLDQIEVNTSYGDNTGGGTESGALRVTIASDSTGVISIDDGGGTITVDGTVTANLSATDNAVLDDIAAKLAPHATNGHSTYLNQDTSAISAVKGSAGTIYWISCMSTDATPVYLNLYDSTTATLGSTTPTNQFIIPTQGDANGSGFTINFGPLGVQYSTGIQVAAATSFNGSTDPGTNIVITNIGYE